MTMSTRHVSERVEFKIGRIMVLSLSDPQKNLEDFRKRFEDMSDEQLIDTFKAELGKPGCVSSRAMFHSALREEFEKRGLEMMI